MLILYIHYFFHGHTLGHVFQDCQMQTLSLNKSYDRCGNYKQVEYFSLTDADDQEYTGSDQVH